MRCAALSLLVVVLAGCGAAGRVAVHRTSASATRVDGIALTPARPAPPLALTNYTGQRVSLGGLRGHAVLVTFVYTHCADVCPLIVSNLAAAYHALGLGQRRRVRILAVTVDPRRDTRAVVSAFLAARDATGTMDYLLGPRRRLLRTWRAWDIEARIGASAVTSGHTAVVFGITASGRASVVYPPNFTPAEIVHDVPLLAAG